MTRQSNSAAAALVFLLWWLVCLLGVTALLVTGARDFATAKFKVSWHIATKDVDRLKKSPLSHTQIKRELTRLANAFNLGEIDSLDALAKQVANLPFVQQAQVIKTSQYGAHLAITLFTPLALLNDNYYVNRGGEIKRKSPSSHYNPPLRLYLPHQQFKQFFPFIDQLITIVAREGLALASIQITSSGIWTVSYVNNWVMIFGPQPDFPQLFDQLKQALDGMYKYGTPRRFDFRYDRAIAVTYEKPLH